MTGASGCGPAAAGQFGQCRAGEDERRDKRGDRIAGQAENRCAVPKCQRQRAAGFQRDPPGGEVAMRLSGVRRRGLHRRRWHRRRSGSPGRRCAPVSSAARIAHPGRRAMRPRSRTSYPQALDKGGQHRAVGVIDAVRGQRASPGSASSSPVDRIATVSCPWTGARSRPAAAKSARSGRAEAVAREQERLARPGNPRPRPGHWRRA